MYGQYQGLCRVCGVCGVHRICLKRSSSYHVDVQAKGHQHTTEQYDLHPMEETKEAASECAAFDLLVSREDTFLCSGNARRGMCI